MRVERPGIRIEPEPDQLGDAEDDAAHHGAPEGAEAAEHHDLEGDQQPLDPGVRREGRAHREQHAGDAGQRERQAHHDVVDAPGVHAHQPHDVAIVGGGPHDPAESGARQDELERGEQRDRQRQDQERQDADRAVPRSPTLAWASRPAGMLRGSAPKTSTMRLRMTTATPNVSRMAAKGSGRVTTRLIEDRLQAEAEDEGDERDRQQERQRMQPGEDARRATRR